MHFAFPLFAKESILNWTSVFEKPMMREKDIRTNDMYAVMQDKVTSGGKSVHDNWKHISAIEGAKINFRSVMFEIAWIVSSSCVT